MIRGLVSRAVKMEREATYYGHNNESGKWKTCGTGYPGWKISYAHTTIAGGAEGYILGIRLCIPRGIVNRLVRMTILEHRHQGP